MPSWNSPLKRCLFESWRDRQDTSDPVTTYYRAVDRGHAQLLRDRGTLDAVGRAVEHVTRDREVAARASADGDPLSIGELARRLGVTAATLRN